MKEMEISLCMWKVCTANSQKKKQVAKQGKAVENQKLKLLQAETPSILAEEARALCC